MEFGFSEPGNLALFTGTIAAVVGILERLLLKSEKDSLGQKFMAWMRVLLSFRLQAIMYLIAVSVALTFSSIVIVADEHSAGAKGTISFLDGADAIEVTLGAAGTPSQYRTTTTPFGRPFRIQLDHHLAANFDLYPLSGHRIRPEDDLQPAPSVLFRPPWKALRFLQDGGEFIVRQKGQSVPLAQYKSHRSSFIVGSQRSFRPDNLGNWRLELIALQTATNTEARTLLEWSDPVFLSSTSPLKPGMELQAVVVTVTGVEVAKVDVTLGRDRLLDVPMLDLLTEPQ
jgi:hypothetical protein